MSKELRNTPDLWIFIYVFGPENDSCLWVDILALLSEEASLSFCAYLCSSFTKARSCRKTLGEKHVGSVSQSPSGSLYIPSPLLSAVLGSLRCGSALGCSRGSAPVNHSPGAWQPLLPFHLVPGLQPLLPAAPSAECQTWLPFSSRSCWRKHAQ